MYIQRIAVRIPSLFLMCDRYIQHWRYNSGIPRIAECFLLTNYLGTEIK
jgi:hypothetical protein